MPKYSILMRVPSLPAPTALPPMTPAAAIASVLAQTVSDWELLLVGEPADLAAWVNEDPRIRTVSAPADEALAFTAQRIQAELGTWVGFLGAYDTLVPDTLDQLDLGIALNPAAKAVFTDEECVNWFGQVSMRFRKGAFNPLRLRSQEYLRDFTVLHWPTVQAYGGFNRLASTIPGHDVYLRLLEVFGPGAFLHIPQRLYRRFRDHRAARPRMGYDAAAIQAYLERQGTPVTVRQLDGRLDLEYHYADRPTVTVLILVTDDTTEGLHRIHAATTGTRYRPAELRIVHLGNDPTAAREYRALCGPLDLTYSAQSDISIAAAVNLEAQHVDSRLLCVLQGAPINNRWLHRLVDHACLPGIGAVGARCMAGRRLHFPGLVGHSHDGWDWNTAGRFDVMAVPHQTSAVGSACLLIDTRRFLQLGGFETDYPTLYAHELSLRLDAAGYANVYVPGCQISVADTSLDPGERAQLASAWPNWSDRFDLHLPLQE